MMKVKTISVSSSRMKSGVALNLTFSLTLILGTFTVVQADTSTCGDNVQTRIVTYLPISGTLITNSLDARTDPGVPPPGTLQNEVKLRGMLYYRRDAGETLKNRKVLIFVHGHEAGRPEPCNVARYFTERGWVVFAALRRGHFVDYNGDDDGDDPGDVRSTGVHIDTYVDKCQRSQADAEESGYMPHLYYCSGFCRPDLPCQTLTTRRNAVELDYLSQQRIDVRDQINYVKTLLPITDGTVNRNWRLADPNQITILGHSYGGALVVITNANDYGQNAAIDISGAELSWENSDEPWWEYDLSASMELRKRPIYMFQPRNGRFLSPTKTLFGIGADNRYPSQAAIFPSAPCLDILPSGECDDEDVPEWKQAHVTFVSDDLQIARWGQTVTQFSNRYRR